MRSYVAGYFKLLFHLLHFALLSYAVL